MGALLLLLFPFFAPALQREAIRLEILDPRERRYILAQPRDCLSDLTILRRRFLDLADAPPLSDASRFPDRASVNDLLTLNRERRHIFDMQRTVCPRYWSELTAEMRETERRYQIWDNVRDARCEHYFVTVRRHALKRILELAGPDAYYACDLPAVVPIWE